MIDLTLLIAWLGVEGAKAGLDKSDLTISEIMDLDSSHKLSPSSKLRRPEVIELVIENRRKELYKSPDELMDMDVEAIKSYFSEYRFTKEELLRLLESMDIRPSGEARKKLNDFAAREISEIGRFKRVAHGKSSSDSPKSR